MNQWWFASENFTNGFSQLKSPTKADQEKRFFRDAQELSITVEEAWINVDLDRLFNKDNDLIIASRYQIGSKRIVDKIHFLKRNYPEQETVGPFFHSTIYATKDFQESSNDITLQIRVYDEDGLSCKEIESLQNTLSTVGTASAVAFPAFAPIAGLATGIGNSLVSLIDNLDDHDRIIDGTIKLEINKPEDQGYDHLQPGFIICFRDEIKEENLYLGEDKQIYSNTNGELYKNNSYIVLRIRRSFIEDPDFEANEHAATLLTEIENGKKGKSVKSLSFVKDTFDSYTKFKKLKRIKELKAKEELTEDEQKLLTKLENDSTIVEFLN